MSERRDVSEIWAVVRLNCRQGGLSKTVYLPQFWKLECPRAGLENVICPRSQQLASREPSPLGRKSSGWLAACSTWCWSLPSCRALTSQLFLLCTSSFWGLDVYLEVWVSGTTSESQVTRNGGLAAEFDHHVRSYYLLLGPLLSVSDTPAVHSSTISK